MQQSKNEQHWQRIFQLQAESGLTKSHVAVLNRS